MNAALVLAAGRGTRVGGPKALMLVDGAPLALAHARARERDCDRVIVVARKDVIDALQPAHPQGWCPSDEDDALGPAGSIRAAVRRGVLSVIDVVLVTPVDVVPAPASIVRALFEAITDGVDAARFEHGHPVAVRASVLVERYIREALPLRDVLASLGARVRVLASPREPLPRSLDRVDDVVAFTGASPRFWSPA